MTIPAWMAELEDEDLAFIKKFILASGSLKEVASVYGVSYPTVRLRLDRLIQKIQLTETAEAGAIKVFGKNLEQLLMQPPIVGKVVLGWDPAFRTGCKRR